MVAPVEPRTSSTSSTDGDHHHYHAEDAEMAHRSPHQPAYANQQQYPHQQQEQQYPRSPTQVTYRDTFEPFTTGQYMYPEPGSWHLDDLEGFQVDNLVLDDIKIAESMLHAAHMPSSVHFWFKEFLPRIAYEWCFWFDRRVTSIEVDARMAALLSAMLSHFHHHIVDQETHRRYSVWDLLESVRAVRDVRERAQGGLSRCVAPDKTALTGWEQRLHPESSGQQWEDEWA